MSLIIIARFLTSLLSWALLAAMIYLGWSWYQGELVQTPDGDLIRVREDWRLWVLGGCLLWSVFGKFIITPLLSKPDRRPLTTRRGDGQNITGINDASLYVETHGQPDGPTIILTHGWGLDSTIWGYAKEDLSAGHKVIVWDLPGMGLSKPGSDGITLSAFAANLKHLVEQSSAEKVILVGHSIGGMTMQTLARDFPEFFESRVAGAVLVNTTYINPLRTMILSKLVLGLQKPVIKPMMMMTKWFTPLAWLSGWQSYFNGGAHLANRIGFGPLVTHSQLGYTALLSTRNSPGAQASGNLAMFDWDAGQALRDSRVPVLVMAGNMDIVTKVEASETIAAMTPASELRRIDRANHMGFLECGDQYNEAIMAFAKHSTVQSKLMPSNPQVFSHLPEESEITNAYLAKTQYI